MCGIFGAVLEHPGQVDADSAVAALGHRGPDDRGIFRGEGIVLGHARLAILDLTPAATQPMVSFDGTLVAVFNGEIYNHRSLRAEREKDGHRFVTRSDTEVVMAGFRAWGDALPERLDGMFALALWDLRQRRLFAARDRAGKKPFFYCARPGDFRFASEPKALRASGVATELDLDALPSLLAFGYVSPPRTIHRHVAQLPPASALVLEAGRPPSVRRFWKAPFAAPPLVREAARAADEVRSLVEAAVARRIEADVPVGAFLSGGLDSTIVVALMRRLMGRVQTFSIGFSGDPRFDETAYARLAARALGTEHTELRLEPSSFSIVENLVQAHDGPFGDSSAVPTSMLAQLARTQVKVALSGDGGDELFCGYVRFLAAEAAEMTGPLMGLISPLWKSLPPGRAQGERGWRARVERFFAVAPLPLPERLTRLNSLFAFDLEAMLLPDVRKQVDLDAPLAWTRHLLAESAGASTLTRILDHNFATYLPDDLLVKTDRASMLHGLEVRSPFLDTALIEYVARLPDRLKRRGWRTKWILRRAFADLVPRPILRRSKMGFGMPLGSWFRGSLRPYLEDHLAETAHLYELISRRYVAQLLEQHFSGAADHGHRLWLLLTLEVWLRFLSRPQLACAA